MKKIIIFFATVVLLLGATTKSYAQLDWNTAGNTIGGTEWFGADNSSTIPVRYEHQTNGAVSRFEWYTTDGTLQERMRLTRAGWLGLNIAAPDMMLHVDDGGILSTGTTGTNPDLGAGTRLMWIPDQAAFRAGEVDGTQWDDTDVGDHSVAFGQNNLVSGDWSVAFADGNEVTGLRSFAFGGSNNLSGNNSIGLGASNTINNTGGVGIGVRNTIDGDFGVAIGRFLHANAENAIALGRGIDAANLLENATQNSLMVGFNSNLSTLFVGPSQGIDTFGSVGIGNITAPTERIDVNGTARLRVMPYDTADVFITGVQADTVTGDYVLHYIPADSLGFECDWNIVDGGDNLATGFEDACVEGKVLVGVDQDPFPNGPKVQFYNIDEPTTLAVESDGSNNGQFAAIFSALNGTNSSIGVNAQALNSPMNVGVLGNAADSENRNLGVRGNAESGGINFGVYGESRDSEMLGYGVYGISFGDTDPNGPDQSVGVYGESRDYATSEGFGGYFYSCESENNYGVYGEACDTTNDVAGYFAGPVVTNQTPISLSDESIKNNMADIEDAMGVINQLNPIKYQYSTESFPHLHLDSGFSYGFSAQEVQAILPDIVEEVRHPAKYDTTGQMISPSEELLGIQYQELISILTAGMKEQQSTIEAQNEAISNLMDQMNDLQNQIDDCCSGTPAPKDFGGDGNGSEGIDDQKGENTLDQNVPNPFHTETTISYSLEQGGKVMLNVYDKNGKMLETLVEAEQSAGTYKYIWNASGQPAGLYHYALYVDGELLMKKAIKLAD